MMKMWS